jgi:hypothetical protein
MRRFQLDSYKTPEKIISQDADISGTIEDAFLFVPLKDNGGEIEFFITGGLNTLKSKLL